MGTKFVAIFIGAATGLSLMLDSAGTMLGGDYSGFHVLMLVGSFLLLVICIFTLGFLLYQADRLAGKIPEKRRIKLYERLMDSSKR